MIGRVVEIASNNRHLAIKRGSMVVKEDGAEIGRVPLDDIAVLVVNAHGITYSNNLLVKLAERGTAVVICGANHMPVSWMWPLDGHHVQASRMAAQLQAARPLHKRLWQIIIRAKIAQQAAVLDNAGKPSGGFDLLARRVRSGDPDNIEAQAARRYWPLLMGADFRRERSSGGANALLNYGYTVMRAATARAVVTAGLHPSLGIHHSNRGNAMCLVDDLMEPFRPIVDLVCARLAAQEDAEITPETKKQLADVLCMDMQTDRGASPVLTCLERLATSLAKSFEENRAELDLPLSPLPLDLVGGGR